MSRISIVRGTAGQPIPDTFAVMLTNAEFLSFFRRERLPTDGKDPWFGEHKVTIKNHPTNPNRIQLLVGPKGQYKIGKASGSEKFACRISHRDITKLGIAPVKRKDSNAKLFFFDGDPTKIEVELNDCFYNDLRSAASPQQLSTRQPTVVMPHEVSVEEQMRKAVHLFNEAAALISDLEVEYDRATRTLTVNRTVIQTF